MDVMSFVLGFVSAIAIAGVAVFALGIAAYVKQNKNKK